MDLATRLALGLIVLSVTCCSPPESPEGSDEASIVSNDGWSPSPIAERRARPSRSKLIAASRTLRLEAAVQPSIAASPLLTYFGGPIIRDAQIRTVFWSDAIPDAERDDLARFLQTIAGQGSPYFAMLDEYDTIAPAQTVGFGRVIGSVIDRDAPKATAVSDEQIQAELARLIDEGRIPEGAGNDLLMVYFPPGVQINNNGELSCQAFCGYHGAFTRNGQTVLYAVFPDLASGGCQTSCAFTANPLDNLHRVSSHELTEAVTDPDVNLALPSAPPLGWYDRHAVFNGEIGDLCELFPDDLVAGFHVQREWSNADRGCRSGPSAAHRTIDVSPSAVRLPVGESAVATISLTGTGPATISTALVPQGVHATLSATPGRPILVTFTADPGRISTIATPLVYLKDTAGEYHYSVPIVLIEGPPPTLTRASVASGATEGGTTVVLTGTNMSDFVGVTVGGIGAEVIDEAADGSSVTILTPGGAAGLADIAIQNPDGKSAVLTGAFAYVKRSVPSISAVDPPSGPRVGDPFNIVTISGTDLPFDPVVTFGGTRVAVFGSDGTNIAVATPTAAAAGIVDVVVSGPDGQSATLSRGYTFGKNAPPTIDSLSASSANRPTYVTIFGNHFEDVQVLFGGRQAQVRSTNPRFIGVVAPRPRSLGPVDVVVINGDGQSVTLKNGFTFTR